MKQFYKITCQGGPIVNCGIVISATAKIVALEFDLASKYCEVFCTGSSCVRRKSIPVVAVEITNRTKTACGSYNKKAEDLPTEISFTGYPGWSVFATDMGRYTLRVCLIKGS